MVPKSAFRSENCTRSTCARSIAGLPAGGDSQYDQVPGYPSGSMTDWAERRDEMGTTTSFHSSDAKTFRLQAEPSFSTRVSRMTDGATTPLSLMWIDLAPAMP